MPAVRKGMLSFSSSFSRNKIKEFLSVFNADDCSLGKIYEKKVKTSLLGIPGERLLFIGETFG